MLMKLSALLLLVFASNLVNSQTILTTYYVVPPTSGCNGLAAFGPASTIWQPPCSAPYTYVAEPDGCAQGAASGGAVIWFYQDTVYANVCSTPCTITIYDTSGECVTLCQIPVNTEVSQHAAAGTPELNITPNPFAVGTSLQISTPQEAPDNITILDAQGRMVDRILHPTQVALFSTADFHAGLHLLQARWKDGRTSTHRLIAQ